MWRGRLCHVQQLGCTMEVEGFGQGNDLLELAELH
jgi:hypothetical protein